MRWGFVAAVAGLFALGCASGGGGDSGDTGGNGTQAAVQEYKDLTAQLNEHRVEVLGETAGEIAAAYDRLFFVYTTEWDFQLASLQGDHELDYTFPVGDVNTFNYAASDEVVATAQDNVYSVYDIGDPEQLVEQIELERPSYAQWWCYSVDRSDLWIAKDEGDTVLYKVVDGDLQKVLTFETDVGIQVGELWGFMIVGDTLVLDESGRIWLVDLPSETGTWIGNEYEVQSLVLDDDGVLYTAANGPFWYDAASGDTTDLTQAILDSGYHLNDTFAAIHEYDGDTVVKYGKYAVYRGKYGIFALDLESGDVAPVLLDDMYSETMTVYRYPTLLDDGTLFVQGLESTDGATGADGPIYRVDGWMP